MNTVEIKEQLKKAIVLICNEYEKSGEPVVGNYLSYYSDALNALEVDEFDVFQLGKLRGCARSYLEVSSNWDQPFLHEMGKTEKLIKTILGE